eukprot:1157448-Pelagomonas_calceolata.AAC.1
MQRTRSWSRSPRPISPTSQGEQPAQPPLRLQRSRPSHTRQQAHPLNPHQWRPTRKAGLPCKPHSLDSPKPTEATHPAASRSSRRVPDRRSASSTRPKGTLGGRRTGRAGPTRTACVPEHPHVDASNRNKAGCM